MHVHNVEKTFKDLGGCVNGDGIVGDTGFELVSEEGTKRESEHASRLYVVICPPRAVVSGYRGSNEA